MPLSPAVGSTTAVGETFFTDSHLTVPEMIDFLSPVIISTWMICCPATAWDVKDLSPQGSQRC